MNENKECCIYCRVSSEQQNETNQIPECREFAEQLGLKVVEVIQEKISAFKNPDRESIKKLSNYPHVIIWAYDRLYRNRIKFIQAMQYFALKGVKIHSVRESWFEEFHKIPCPWDTILFDLMLQVIGWFSEDESKKKSERIKLAFNNKSEDLHWGRPVKEIDIERLRECYDPNSLRKTARAYNEIFRGKSRISYNTVKKIRDKNLDYFNKSEVVNQSGDLFTSR
jgi:DNA invertase Pin-like site-specific DNA recombinase